MPETRERPSAGVAGLARDLAKFMMLGPIAIYRWTISPLLGVNCRHLPSCSDYAREAIDKNGAWKGGWLTLARVCRCHPWGSHGFDPVPDLSGEHHPLAPWRYGRWRLPLNARDAGAENR
ncbi:MAG: membrane protein insertion efficiency factor YidD [Methyloceanibacter sp.]|uniref:membrane protein insertion efficiency factor YidD n=1 Tax=Methyloceanibacter sp. TaxID=1965321 RepID=UPI003D9BF52D